MSDKPKRHGNCILTRELIKRFCVEIEQVLVVKHACILAGFSHDAFYDWRKKGLEAIKKGDIEDDFAVFVSSYQSALCRAVRRLVLDVAEKPNRWQASAWLLERCFREDFGIDAGIIQKLAEDMTRLEEQIKMMMERHGVK